MGQAPQNSKLNDSILYMNKHNVGYTAPIYYLIKKLFKTYN